MNRKIENLEWYRVFYHTAKSGSFSKAADELYITQPAVSHAIRQLEDRIGGPLFLRTSKGVKLTAEGNVLFSFVSEAFRYLSAGERKLADMHMLTEGEIRIGAGDTLCRYYLLPYLEAFHREYPHIKIQVTNRTSQETIGLLKDGKIDFGVINLPAEDRMIEIRESVSLQDCFVAGEPYRELAERETTLQELSRYPLLLLEKGSSIRRFVDRYAQEQGIAITPEIELGSIELLVQFARIGLGVACVIRTFIADELEQGHLHEVRLTPPLPPRKVGIAVLRDVPLSAAARQFLQLLP